jgi:hypothetical protein
VYTIATHHLGCASCNPSGAPDGIDAETWLAGGGGTEDVGHGARFISDDGRYAFFTTQEALVPQDVNGKRDVYEYDTTTGRVSLISSGTSDSDSYFMETNPAGDEAHPSGYDVLFATQQRLVGWDRDVAYDLYDARIDGGFAEPQPAAIACGSAECHGPLATAPGPVVVASAGAGGTGNLLVAPKRRAQACRAGFVRRRVKRRLRCVRPKRSRGHVKRSRRGMGR